MNWINVALSNPDRLKFQEQHRSSGSA